MRKAIPAIPLLVAAAVLSLACADACLAAAPDKGIIFEIKNEFERNANHYLDTFRKLALGIFKIFFLASVALHGARVALGRVEMGEALKEFLLTLCFAAFCYAAIAHYERWTNFLFDVERQVAVTGLGIHFLSLEPVETAFMLWALALDHAGIVGLFTGKTFVILFLGLLILAIMGMMTARILVVICETYLTMSLGVILLGFGAASFARDYALAAMKYVVSLVFKLLAMHLVIAVGLNFIKRLAEATEGEGWVYTFAYIFMASCILYIIQHTLAEAIGGLISGAHIGDGKGMASALGAARSTVTNTAGVVGLPVRAAGMATAGIGAVSRAAKIASLEGHGGFGGTIGQMWRGYQEARLDEKRSGLAPSPIGESRRVGAMMTDRHEAMRAINDPAYQPNEYSKGRTGNELANQGRAERRHEQLADALAKNTAAMQAFTSVFGGGVQQGGGFNAFRMGDYEFGSFTGSNGQGDDRTRQAGAAQQKANSRETDAAPPRRGKAPEKR